MSSINHQRRHVLKSGLSLGIGSLVTSRIGFAESESLHFLDATEQAKFDQNRPSICPGNGHVSN